jgi:hypothetical protein
MFSHTKAAGNVTRLEIDLFSFFSAFVGGRLATWVTVGFAVVIAPFLLSAWRRFPENAWALGITWMLILNFYVLIYDATFIILSVLCVIATFDLSRPLRWLLVALFLLPWPEVTLARRFGVQVFTIVLVAFGLYQLARVRATDRHIRLPGLEAGAT